MSHLTISDLETQFEKGWTATDADGERYVYAETGRYKPFMPATLKAAERRGYRVVRKGSGVFYVYAPVRTADSSPSSVTPDTLYWITSDRWAAESVQVSPRDLANEAHSNWYDKAQERIGHDLEPAPLVSITFDAQFIYADGEKIGQIADPRATEEV